MRAISRLASLAARVEYNRTLPSLLACKTRPCLALHPPTGNRQFRAQLLRAGKSAKITFSKIKLLLLECRGNTRFLKNYGIFVKKYWEILFLQWYWSLPFTGCIVTVAPCRLNDFIIQHKPCRSFGIGGALGLLFYKKLRHVLAE